MGRVTLQLQPISCPIPPQEGLFVSLNGFCMDKANFPPIPPFTHGYVFNKLMGPQITPVTLLGFSDLRLSLPSVGGFRCRCLMDISPPPNGRLGLSQGQSNHRQSKQPFSFHHHCQLAAAALWLKFCFFSWRVFQSQLSASSCMTACWRVPAATA